MAENVNGIIGNVVFDATNIRIHNQSKYRKIKSATFICESWSAKDNDGNPIEIDLKTFTPEKGDNAGVELTTVKCPNTVAIYKDPTDKDFEILDTTFNRFTYSIEKAKISAILCEKRSEDENNFLRVVAILPEGCEVIGETRQNPFTALAN